MRRMVFVALAALIGAAGCNDNPTVVRGAPDAPRALEGSYYAGAVTLTWELGPDWDGESFLVYGKRVSDSDYFFIADVTSCTGGVCTYTDTNIEEDVTYEYYVAAYDDASGLETPSTSSVEVYAPVRTPPQVPDQTRVVALDDANFIVWGVRSRESADFSFYRVYQAAPDGNDYLLGETDSEGFLDLLAGNGLTYEYFVTAVDADGHESAGSVIAEGTPRPDYAGEILYDYFDDASLSGFRFQEDEATSPILPGDDPDAHFSVERDPSGLWLLRPGPAAGSQVHPTGVFTSALKCGVAADQTCLDATIAPTTGYTADAVGIDPEYTYFLRVIGDDGEVHYGAIRIVMQGENQNGGVVIFDWSYQLQAGNPQLAPTAP